MQELSPFAASLADNDRVTASTLELHLRTLALSFAEKLRAIARSSNIDELAYIEVGPPRPVEPPPKPPEAQFVSVERTSFGGTLVRPKSVDLAKAMAAAVASLPWAARSRELQVLLGLSKTQFLRVALLAIHMGLVHRTGEKAGIEYFLGPEDKGAKKPRVVVREVHTVPRRARRSRGPTGAAKALGQR